MEQLQLLTRCPQAMSSDNPEQNISTGFNESQAGIACDCAQMISSDFVQITFFR